MATISLASFGGTFISGGQSGRKGYFVPMDDDLRDEELFLNCNDYLRHAPIPFEEFADQGNTLFAFAQSDNEDDRDLSDRLCNTQLTTNQIMAAAAVMIENPELLVNLYRQAMEIDEDDFMMTPDYHKKVVEPTLIKFLRGTFATMLKAKSAKDINRSLMLRRDAESGKTLLSLLAQFARQELKAKVACGAALPIMRSLGHDDVFASYLG